MIKPSRILELSALLIVLCGHATAFAAEYRWRPIYFMAFNLTNSPLQACKSMEGAVGANAGGMTKANFVYLKQTSETSYACYYQIYYWNSKSKTWVPSGEPRTYIGWGAFAAREGDSCPLGKVLSTDQSEGSCSFPKGVPKGDVCQNGVVANPINTASGNKIQSEIDFISKGSSLQFGRFYNSSDGLWRHNYSIHLVFTSPSKIVLFMNDGRESTFTVSNNVISGSVTELGRLDKIDQGWTYSLFNQKYSFDQAGRLIENNNSI